MPDTRYFLADAVLTGLYAMHDRDCRAILAAFDQIAEAPQAMADTVGNDWDGRRVYLAHSGRFEIGYVVLPESGKVTFTLLRPTAR